MAYQNLLIERGPVALVTINRPKALNALDVTTVDELGAVVAELDADRAVRAVILTGAGEKAFVAGADIGAMAGLTAAEATAFAIDGQAVLASIETSRVPWIAAVNGFALGGGLELALACDFIYASKNAKLGQPEVNLGVIPGFGGTQRLLRRVGAARARELVYTGTAFTADDAWRFGLVQGVFEPAELLAGARAAAGAIAAKGPLAIAAAKRVILEGEGLALPAACAREAEAFGRLFASQDQKEGMRAFLEKRPAQFTGK